jgi:hypothetical protein
VIRTRTIRHALVAALLLGTACDCNCDWLTPDATRERRIGERVVEITAKGGRHVGVDGIGAPHAFGVLWPTIDGYGYTLRMKIDDRPEFELGTASFHRDRMPTEEELQALADAVEVTFSQNQDHVAYRRDATTGWRVLHLLPRGRAFDSEKSDTFARQVVDASALDFSSLPSAEALGLEILRAPDRNDRRGPFWEALAEQPTGGVWDQPLLDLWPGETRTQPLIEARVAPRSSSTPAFRAAAVSKALAGLRTNPGRADECARIVEASARAQDLATLDAELVALFPRADIAEPLRRRLRATHSDVSRASFRNDARAKALADIGNVRPDHQVAFGRAVRVVQACEDNDTPLVLYEAMLPIWPASEDAHLWLTEHFQETPAAIHPRLLAHARARVNDAGIEGDRASALACYLLRRDGACREIAALEPRAHDACFKPSRCP